MGQSLAGPYNVTTNFTPDTAPLLERSNASSSAPRPCPTTFAGGEILMVFAASASGSQDAKTASPISFIAGKDGPAGPNSSTAAKTCVTMSGHIGVEESTSQLVGRPSLLNYGWKSNSLPPTLTPAGKPSCGTIGFVVATNESFKPSCSAT